MLETKNHNKNGHAALLKNGLKSRERERVLKYCILLSYLACVSVILVLGRWHGNSYYF